MMVEERRSLEICSEAQKQSAPEARLAALRVLIVEDVPSQQKFLATVMKKSGHVVSCADNGQDAVALFEREPFDLVLMDVQMPGMNGLDAMRAIRSFEARSGKHVAILAVTAHALNGDADKCLEAGADSYLRKPIRLDDLKQQLKQLLSSA